MKRIKGFSRQQLDRRVARVEPLVKRALNEALRSVTIRLDGTVIRAAGADQGGAQPSAVVTVDDLGSIATVWREQVAGVIMPLVGEIYNESAAVISRRIAQALVTDVPAIPQETAQQYLSQAENRLRNVSDHVWETARNELIEGMQKGESSQELAQRITGSAGLTESRAMATARTEVISASNIGSLTQVKVGGFTGKKEWLDTNDSRTRESHRLAGGQKVPIEGKFTVGGYAMDCPGDHNAPADETVQCRCTLAYDLDEESTVDSVTAALGDPVENADDDELEDALDEGVDEEEEDSGPQHTGAMIALVPSAEDIDRITLAGGEAPEELHLTLYFLGEAEMYPQATQQQIIETVMSLCATQVAIQGEGFGVSYWNPDAEPCIVMNVGGEQLSEAREGVGEALEEIWAACLPDQHSPWIPHITLAYTNNTALIVQAASATGPITFDRVRVAFGEEVTDVPLYSGIGVIASADTGVTVREIPLTSMAASGDPNVVPPGKPAAPTAPPVGDAAMTDMSGTAWEGILVIEGVETGDGRMFSEGSLTWDQPPLALRWVPSDEGEHKGAVTTGRIDNVWRDPQSPATIRGSGVFDDQGVHGAEALRLVRGQFLKGVSVDVDSVKDADVEYVMPESQADPESASDDDVLMDLFAMPELMIFHKGRLRAATLCDIPAFTEAQIWLTDGTMDMTQSAPAGEAYALDKQFTHGCGDNVNITACAVGIGALLTDPRLPLDMSQRKATYDHLSEHLQAAGLTPQPFEAASFSEEVAALVAGLVPVDTEAPPEAWFTDPQLPGPTPITITNEGRIFGHGAVWGTCHTGFADACVTPPEENEHAYFRQGELVTREGSRFAVGHITLGTGHAPTFGVDPRRAVEHYDNTGTVVADVVSGNDEYGIWVSGSVRPGLPPARIRELRAAKLSGDWRRIGGSLRLVAFLAVNVPGFPVPRLKTEVKEGRQLSLVASGVVTDTPVKGTSGRREALESMKLSLQRRLGRDPKSRALALRAKVHGGEH